MTEQEMMYFRNLLTSRREEVLEQLGRIEERTFNATRKDASGELSAYSTHPADQGTETMGQEMAAHFATIDANYLYHIERAIERIDRGNFGICRVCGCEIGRERLEAVPHATLCIQCKSEEEQVKRGR
jgi:RNA polymerase-binding protein DksA